jgi:hypothetical protein
LQHLKQELHAILLKPQAGELVARGRGLHHELKKPPNGNQRRRHLQQ